MKIIIIGAGEVGFQLAKLLSQEDYDITIIDPDKQKILRAEDNIDVNAIQGNGTNHTILSNAGIEDADVVVSVTGMDESNLIISKISKNLGCKKVIARLRNIDYSNKNYIINPENFGIDEIIHPEMEAKSEINRLVIQNSANYVYDIDENLKLLGVKINDSSSLINKNLSLIKSNNKSLSFNIIGLTRDEETIVPNGETKIKKGDEGYFLVKKNDIEHLMYILGKQVNQTKNVMILGGGKIGRAVANDFQDDLNVRLVEINKDKADMIASKFNITVLNDDGTDIEFLRLENLEELDSFIAVTENDQTNLMSALLAKHLGVKQNIIHVSHTEYIPAMTMIGLDAVVSKSICTVNKIISYIKTDDNHEIEKIGNTQLESIDYKPKKGSRITFFKSLASEKFPENSIIGCIQHKNGSFSIANGDSIVTSDDIVKVFALPEAIKEVDKFFI